MKKAFTLIELLVVIAIIAILAAILFPVFAQAKAAAKKTVGLSDAKQIALGAQMYASDADDHIVLNGQSDAENLLWADLLQPYIKSYALFAPPAGQENEFWQSRRSRNANGKKDIGFIINNVYWYSPQHGQLFEQSSGTASMTSLANPADTVFAGDGGMDGVLYPYGVQVATYATNGSDTASTPDVFYGKLTSGPLSGRLIVGSKGNRQGFFLARYNNDSLTSAFFDGHAKAIKTDELVKTNSQGHYVHFSKADLTP